MSGSDLLRAAAAELYGGAPHEFIARRAELARAARAARDLPAAQAIGALRKPVQSAWIVNQLVRAVPDAPDRLSELGIGLRKAQRSLDGTALRELSARRRALVDELTRQAFTAVGQSGPPAALRDEVATTLAAAVADPDIADELAAGTMSRAARSDGFGASAPVLTLIGPVSESSSSGSRTTSSSSGPRTTSSGSRTTPGGRSDSGSALSKPGSRTTSGDRSDPGSGASGPGSRTTPRRRPDRQALAAAPVPGPAPVAVGPDTGSALPTRTGRNKTVRSNKTAERNKTVRSSQTAGRNKTAGTRSGAEPSAAQVRRQAAIRDKQEAARERQEAAEERAREQRHRRVVAAAERAVAAADKAADAATKAEQKQEAAVAALADRLADARQELAGARAQARQARSRQRSGRAALNRARARDQD